jgi:hypothetical protein
MSLELELVESVDILFDNYKQRGKIYEENVTSTLTSFFATAVNMLESWYRGHVDTVSEDVYSSLMNDLTVIPTTAVETVGESYGNELAKERRSLHSRNRDKILIIHQFSQLQKALFDEWEAYNEDDFFASKNKTFDASILALNTESLFLGNTSSNTGRSNGTSRSKGSKNGLSSARRGKTGNYSKPLSSRGSMGGSSGRVGVDTRGNNSSRVNTSSGGNNSNSSRVNSSRQI